MEKLFIHLTLNYSHTNERWNQISTLSLHERILYRGTILARCGYPIQNMQNWNNPTLTKEERTRDYNRRCLENNIRPFNYSDEQWEDHLDECRINNHIDRCTNQQGYLYQY